MHTRFFQSFAALVALTFSLSLSAQTWTAPTANAIESACTTPPCVVSINPGNTTNSAIGLDVGGDVIARGASIDFMASSTSGPAALVASASASNHAFLLLRSGGVESVILRREANTNDFVVAVATVERMRFKQNGTIGVGTSVPASWFDVVSAPSSSQFYTQSQGSLGGGISHSSLGADSSWLGFDVVRNGNTWYARHSSVAWVTKESGQLTIKTSTGNTVAALAQPIRDLVTIDLATGNTNFTGTVTGTNIRAQYQDVAEWVSASGAMPAGTVVVLNDQKADAVVPSSMPYDTRVAGVVSAQPGLLLGVPGNDKAMIATTGRVRVKVDASKHPVRIGDLLVTSDRQGSAMVSEPIDFHGRAFHQPGTVIGKALEPLASGQGEILVLLSLQ